MENLIIIGLLLIILSLAVFYIVRAKKRGQKCIGCPYAKNCSSKDCNDPNE